MTPDTERRGQAEAASIRSGWRAAGKTVAALLALLVGVAGCENPLDVENPNNLVAEDLNNPQGLSSAVNGALSTTAFAVSDMLAPYATATDQIQNIGSRDAWLQLDYGNVANEANEFTDAAFPTMGRARYMADKAIRLAEQFDEEGTIRNRTNMARAYFVGALIYTTIGDMMEDFVISEPGEGAPPIGSSNMSQVYQTALDYLNSGLQVARSQGASSLVTRMTAMKARIHFASAVWQKLNPPGSTPSDPLIDDQQAADAARAALQRIGNSVDWQWNLEFTSATVDNQLGGWISDAYINLAEENGGGVVDLQEGSLTTINDVTLMDPVDTETEAPEVARKVEDYDTAPLYAPITALSSRELHLIVAETALARGDTATFTEHVNYVRGMDDLTPYDGQIPAMEMLKHSRRSNLFLQGRRLADMYRFGEEAPLWQSGSAAASQPGTFFPITLTEIRANDNLSR